MRSDLTFEDVAFCLEQECEWTFAKTMPRWPHHYTLRSGWRASCDFERVVQFIRETGYEEDFYGKPFIRLDVNEYKYWTMGAPLNETILINRAAIERSAPYDEIAEKYDEAFNTPEAREENFEIYDMIGIKETDSVLDIGCGTGLFLDVRKALKRPKPERYLGIDPSPKMLAKLREKHKTAKVIETTFERFFTTERFDVVIGLFAAPSYIDPMALNQKLEGLLKNGGRYFLMFYRKGYDPVTHRKFGKSIPFHCFDPNTHIIPCMEKVFNNFTIVRGTKVAMGGNLGTGTGLIADWEDMAKALTPGAEPEPAS